MVFPLRLACLWCIHFPKAKARATHLTQDACSYASGNQIQPARLIYLTLTFLIVILPSSILSVYVHTFSLGYLLPGTCSKRKKRIKGLWEIISFWTLSQMLQKSFNPKKIEFGPPRLQYLNKKHYFNWEQRFSPMGYKTNMFYTHSPKYPKYKISFSPHLLHI